MESIVGDPRMSPSGVRLHITGVESVTRTAKLVLVLLVATVSGCTSAPDSAESSVESACFRVRDVRSFEAVDDRFVYVRCVRDRHFLLTMHIACLGLQDSIRVAIGNEFDRVCSTDRALITYRDFDRTRTCEILTVETVGSRERALELVEQRRGPNAASTPDEPE